MAEYLSFDPGETTGFVHASVRNYKDFELLEVGQIAWRSNLTSLFPLLGIQGLQAIIIEDFRMYAHAAQHLIHNRFPAVIVIGRIQGVAFCQCPDVEVVLQMPAERMSVKILPEHESILRGLSHAKDAYRHLRYYLVKNRIVHS